MRLGPRPRYEQVGNVQINELQRVIELDSGSSPPADSGDVIVSADSLTAIESQMVIVIACMNEEDQTIEGVLSGIPHDCLVILVSNSDRTPIDRYEQEARLLDDFCMSACRSAIAVHQKDPGVAAAFTAAGVPELVAADGRIRKGKGEAMIIGMALAAMTGRKYIGYIDADNFIPGSVNEYCQVFAAGLSMAHSPHAMVRISWNSKPKVRNGRLVFDKKGRSSKVVNEWLDRLVQKYPGIDTELIVTGNAGEHAMTLDLGLQLRLAGGYAIEPFELIDILEQYGGQLEGQAQGDNRQSQNQVPNGLAGRSASSEVVEVLQIQTRNPHFHESKGDVHIQKMQLQGLNVLYHSPLTPPQLKADLLRFMVEQGGLKRGREPPRERIYPPVGALDFELFLDVLLPRASSLRQIAGEVDGPLIDPRFIPEQKPKGSKVVL
jgi:mannosyl-3-phosphoglycerate synthase